METHELAGKQSLWLKVDDEYLQKTTIDFTDWVIEIAKDGTPIKLYKKDNNG